MVKPASKKVPKKSKKKTKIKKESFLKRWRAKRQEQKSKRVRLHKSFRRSYREDYHRDLEIPGIMSHIFATFKVIFKNWKIFLPLMIVVIVLNVVLVGLMSESTYVQFQDILDETSEASGTSVNNFIKATLLLISTITTGGLSGSSSEAAIVFAVLIFLIIWLTTIFILRHRLAGQQVKLRDGLYNAMTPLVSTFVVFAITVVQCVPIFILIIVYSTAVQTDFLSTPFYALVFFVFALAMICLSGYLLSSSLIALVAVSAPGLYPMKAMHAASDLMASRRIRFLLRIVALILALIVVWVIVMLPLILFDIWIKTFEWAAGIPFIPCCLLIMTCFTAIYLTAYLYLYYRWMLNYGQK